MSAPRFWADTNMSGPMHRGWVTETARDFSALALPNVSQAGPFEKIQRTPQAVARIGQIATLSAATRKPACQNGASRDLGVARLCSNVFGASLVSVEEIE